jgi:hypothetical protein
MNSTTWLAWGFTSDQSRYENTTSTPPLRYDSNDASAVFSGGHEGIETDNGIRDPVPVHC